MTTTPTASPELLDLDKLEALARAATPGPWGLAKITDRSIEHLCPVDRDRLSLLTVVHEGETPYGAVYRDEDANFVAAIHPEQVLALIALARRAQPYATGGIVPGGLYLAGEAPQATCIVPPEGWYCTRAPAHDGPCAAWPIAQQAAAPGGHAHAKQIADRADQSGFEAWATSHGGLSLDRAGNSLRTDDGLALPTYRFGRTEIAWRAWANRHSSAATSAPGTPEAPKGGA